MSKYAALEMGHIVTAAALQQAGAHLAHTLPGGRMINYIVAGNQPIDSGAIALRRDEASFKQARAALEGRPARREPAAKPQARPPSSAAFRGPLVARPLDATRKENTYRLKQAGLTQSARLYEQDISRRAPHAARRTRNYEALKQLDGLPKNRTMSVGQMMRGSPEPLMAPQPTQGRKSLVTRAMHAAAKTALVLDPVALMAMAATRPSGPRPGAQSLKPAPA
ncbi:MAG: hypothetical protein SFW62_05650 [Alphaproteobacteria bacterium]|nr:hypothetical protein [Alphaproteobacteria bacterium]